MNAEEIAELLKDAVCRAEAARIAGVSAQCVGQWIRRGRVEHGKRYYLKSARWEGGDVVIILRKDLDEWLRMFPPMLQKGHGYAKAGLDQIYQSW